MGIGLGQVLHLPSPLNYATPTSRSSQTAGRSASMSVEHPAKSREAQTPTKNRLAEKIADTRPRARSPNRETTQTVSGCLDRPVAISNLLSRRVVIRQKITESDCEQTTILLLIIHPKDTKVKQSGETLK